MEDQAAIKIQRLYRKYVEEKELLYEQTKRPGGYVLAPKPNKYRNVSLYEWVDLYPTFR